MWACVDDLADRPFYSRARWSGCRVVVHSGRELRFDADRGATFPCAELCRCDNGDVAGVRRCLNEATKADEDGDAQAGDEAKANTSTDDHRGDDRDAGVVSADDPPVELHWSVSRILQQSTTRWSPSRRR